MSLSPTDSPSKLLSQTNELLGNLARLKLNVELYTKVHLLQENVNTLEEKYKKYKSLENDIKTSTCNAQCDNLNSTKDQNSIDDFLIQLLLLKSKSNSPIVPSNTALPTFINDDRASAPPLDDNENESSKPQQQQQASAPPYYE